MGAMKNKGTDEKIEEEMQKVSGVKKAPVTPINAPSSEESSSGSESSGEGSDQENVNNS